MNNGKQEAESEYWTFSAPFGYNFMKRCIIYCLFVAALMWGAMVPVYSQNAAASSVPFNGIVTDLVGTPLKGVRVWVKDARRYALSNRKGRFGLTNVMANDTLHVKYKKVLYDIPVNGQRGIRIKLADQIYAEPGDELVDLGYGFVKKRECTICRNGISGEELIRSGQSTLMAALQGRVPGLNISISNTPGYQSSAYIRGISSINLDCTPLYVVDGVIVNSLDYISVYEVDYVEVLKEASIYGARGANGAILVHTKRGGK